MITVILSLLFFDYFFFFIWDFESKDFFHSYAMINLQAYQSLLFWWNEYQKAVDPQECLLSISQLQQHLHRRYSCCSVNISEVVTALWFLSALPITSLTQQAMDRQLCHFSIKLTAFAPELPQQQGLRDKQMKSQSDNGVLKMGITGAEDVMASLMLLLSIAQILLSLWTIDLTHWKGSFAVPIVQRKGKALSTGIFKAQEKHKAKR